MLSGDEEDYVVDVLADYLAPLQDFRTAAVADLPAALSRTIPLAQTPQLCARLVVNACLSSGWAFSPAAIIRLLTVHGAVHPKIADIISRLKAVLVPATSASSSARVLANGIPFVNRTKLRAITAGFLHPTSAKTVLVVSGASRTGKSYTTPFLRHIGLSHQQICICDLEYSAEQLASTKPFDVAKDIVTLVGRPTLRLQAPDTNASRWLQNLARDVLEETIQSNQRWWFVFDGLYGPGLRTDTRDFINAFADVASRGISQRAFRVFLLGFDRSVLKLPVGSLATEVLGPVDDDEVAECVREALTRSRSAVTDHQPFVDSVLSALPPDPDRLAEVNKRLLQLIESIEEENLRV